MLTKSRLEEDMLILAESGIRGIPATELGSPGTGQALQGCHSLHTPKQEGSAHSDEGGSFGGGRPLTVAVLTGTKDHTDLMGYAQWSLGCYPQVGAGEWRG